MNQLKMTMFLLSLVPLGATADLCNATTCHTERRNSNKWAGREVAIITVLANEKVGGGVEPIIRPVTKKAWPSFLFLVPWYIVYRHRLSRR